ncbi:MAG: DUF808 family protein [Sphingomicrobium sp.]
MPSGLIALLDDVAMIARLAATSMDDMGVAVGKAGAKAAGVVIDDTAVTPRYVTGLSPDRELPIIAKITVGSLKNKLLIILPIALLLAAFAPFAIAPILLLGGLYLAFEATEKILEALFGDHFDEAELFEADTPGELEERQVAGAIRTDFILSAEIMVISLASLAEYSLPLKAVALVLVAILITIAVYGTVAIIVKLDDIGLHLAQRSSAAAQKFGRGLVHGVPYLLSALSKIGTGAMLWVGGGIILHSIGEMGFHAVPDWVHHQAHGLALGSAALEWVVNALAAALFGALAGGLIVAIYHLRPGRHKQSTPKEVI